jgi:phage replication-related protein YjqB (UPF0714/DUF867 family)
MAKNKPKHEDKYKSFDELRRSETREKDYTIAKENRDSNVAIIAPHGGGIEPGTSQITKAIARDRYCYYCFEGLKATEEDNFRDLHITSTKFDEPDCVDLTKRCSIVVAIHGCIDRKKTDQTVYIGGKNIAYRTAIQEALRNAQFETGVHPNPRLQGTDPNNICNRKTNNRDGGVQLEISRTLRDQLTLSQDDLSKFVMAVRNAIISVGGK